MMIWRARTHPPRPSLHLRGLPPLVSKILLLLLQRSAAFFEVLAVAIQPPPKFAELSCRCLISSLAPAHCLLAVCKLALTLSQRALGVLHLLLRTACR